MYSRRMARVGRPLGGISAAIIAALRTRPQTAQQIAAELQISGRTAIVTLSRLKTAGYVEQGRGRAAKFSAVSPDSADDVCASAQTFAILAAALDPKRSLLWEEPEQQAEDREKDNQQKDAAAASA